MRVKKYHLKLDEYFVGNWCFIEHNVWLSKSRYREEYCIVHSPVGDDHWTGSFTDKEIEKLSKKHDISMFIKVFCDDCL